MASIAIFCDGLKPVTRFPPPPLRGCQFATRKRSIASMPEGATSRTSLNGDNTSSNRCACSARNGVSTSWNESAKFDSPLAMSPTRGSIRMVGSCDADSPTSAIHPCNRAPNKAGADSSTAAPLTTVAPPAFSVFCPESQPACAAVRVSAQACHSSIGSASTTGCNTTPADWASDCQTGHWSTTSTSARPPLEARSMCSRWLRCSGFTSPSPISASPTVNRSRSASLWVLAIRRIGTVPAPNVATSLNVRSTSAQ